MMSEVYGLPNVISHWRSGSGDVHITINKIQTQKESERKWVCAHDKTAEKQERETQRKYKRNKNARNLNHKNEWTNQQQQ